MIPRGAGATVPDHVLRFWRGLDQLFQRVEPTWWGAVVTDPRFPAVDDVNYARVDLASNEIGARDIDRALLPALRAAGITSPFHLVSFHPEENRALLAELSARGQRLTWDLVMDHGGLDELIPTSASASALSRVESLTDEDTLWTRVRESMALFGIDRDEAAEQLEAIERRVLHPGGKRWFGVRGPSGSLDALGALIVLEGVGYIDNVATFPHARKRGLASVVTSHMAAIAKEEGTEHVILFADPDAVATVRMYERLGFGPAGYLAAVRGPLPPATHSRGDTIGLTGEAGTAPS